MSNTLFSLPFSVLHDNMHEPLVTMERLLCLTEEKHVTFFRNEKPKTSGVHSHVMYVATGVTFYSAICLSLSHCRYAVYLVMLKKLVRNPNSLELPMFFGRTPCVLVRVGRAESVI